MTAATPKAADLMGLADPATIPDPYPLLASLREASPFTDFGGALAVFGRYEDCSRILRDPRASSERGASILAARRPEQERRRRSFLSLDPPDHTRLRRLVSKAFTPRVIATLEPRINQVTDELLTAAQADDVRELELVSQVAYPLPVRIICEMLGVPPADHARFASWSASLVHSLQPSFGTVDETELLAADEAGREFGEYFVELIAARRSTPGDDLLTKLIRAEDEGDRLTVEELIATAILLLVAGHETTVGLISNAILALLRHPDQFAAVVADPALASAAVEETLRYDAPVQLTGRVAKSEMTFGEVTVPEGAVLLMLLAATGRDPAVFPDPDTFDIGRGEKEHLAFAAGPHFCLGAPLARLEATIALRKIAARVIAPEFDEDRLTYKPNFNLRGPDHLVITYDRIAPG
jgi:cytochrome P450